MAEVVQEFFQSKRQLEFSLKQLANIQDQNSNNFSEAENEWLFDLRDYLDSLAVVDDLFVINPEINFSENLTKETVGEVAKELLGNLKKQNQLLFNIISLATEKLVEKENSNEANDYQKVGDLRRRIASLKGLQELNGILIREGSAVIGNLPDKSQKIPVDNFLKADDEKTKTSFFGKLFGKK